jgi:hypothetical protein
LDLSVLAGDNPDLSGFDFSSLDPSMFDPSQFNEENFDPSTFIQQAGTAATLGPEGGEVVAEAKNGVAYRLFIPAGALTEETYLLMTPIETLNGYPFSGEVYGAVQIEPEGLELNVPARLTIEAPGAGEASAEEPLVNVAFAFDSDGNNFHLTPFAFDSQAVSLAEGRGHQARPAQKPLRAGPLADIMIRELRSQGAGQAKASETSSFAKQHPPSGSRARAAQKLAVKQIEVYGPADEPGSLPQDGQTRAAEVAQRLLAEDTAFRIRMAAGRAGSCKEMMAAIEMYRAYYDAGLDTKASSQTNNALLDALATEARGILEAEKLKCLSPKACAYALATVLSLPSGGGETLVSGVFQEKYPKEFQQAQSELTACEVRLVIESNMIFTPEKGGSQAVLVTANVPLTWTYDSSTDLWFLKGEGPVEYVDINMNAKKCNVVFEKGNHAQFIVTRLQPVIDDKDRITDFHLSDWSSPGDPNEMDLTCPETVNGKEVMVTRRSLLGGGTCHIWCGYFTTARGYARDIWFDVVSSTGVLATKVFDADVPLPFQGGKLTEKSVLALRRVE